MAAPQRKQVEVEVVPPASPRGATRQTSAPRPGLDDRVAQVLLAPSRDALKAEVVRCFKQAADGSAALDLAGLCRFRSLLSQAIEVPEETLGNPQCEYVCFDFDGDGKLQLNEAYKLVKHHLWLHLKKHGVVGQVIIATKSLEQAGYETVRELGQGSQGVVMLAKDAAGRECCVKRLRKGRASLGGLSELKDEYDALRRLSCRRIAQVFDIFQDEHYYYTIGEAYHGGDLTTLRPRASQQGVVMNEKWWRQIVHQCVEALHFLHEQAMMHCDVKEPNIMLKTANFSAPEVVFIDFGVSKAMAATDEGSTVGGTPGYIPPETWERRLWFPSGDIFSLGVCVVQLLTDTVPSSGKRGIFQANCKCLADVKIATLTRQPPLQLLPQDMPGLRSVAARMLEKELEKRPRAPQVLQDPWFSTDKQHLCDGEVQGATHLLGTEGIVETTHNAVPAGGA